MNSKKLTYLLLTACILTGFTIVIFNSNIITFSKENVKTFEIYGNYEKVTADFSVREGQAIQTKDIVTYPLYSSNTFENIIFSPPLYINSYSINAPNDGIFYMERKTRYNVETGSLIAKDYQGNVIGSIPYQISIPQEKTYYLVERK